MTADVLRIVGIALAAVALGQIAVVLSVTWHAMKRPLPPPRFLFWHVAAISVGVGGLLIFTAAELGSRLGHAFTWRIPVVLPALLVVNVSLVLVGIVERARVRMNRDSDAAGRLLRQPFDAAGP